MRVHMLRPRQYRLVLLLGLVLSLGLVGTVTATAPQSSSSNYSIDEVQVGGAGSTQQVCSGGSYCASESAGNTTVGQSSSSNYGASFGTETTDVPLLEVIVTGGNTDLGVLDTPTTATATQTVKVRSYLSSGYSLYITGSPPTQGSHSLKTLDASCPCTSQPGAEQFGVNLVANTSPSLGADPIQVPSGDFSFGTVSSDYNQANLFKYHDGDVVATSDSSTGETDYTLSMIFNISNVTPGGQYKGTFSAVVVPPY